MDPNTTIIDSVAKLAPLGTNALLMIAVVALWRKVNNGYYTAIKEVQIGLKQEIDILRKDMSDTREWLFDLLKENGIEKRTVIRKRAANERG